MRLINILTKWLTPCTFKPLSDYSKFDLYRLCLRDHIRLWADLFEGFIEHSRTIRAEADNLRACRAEIYCLIAISRAETPANYNNADPIIGAELFETETLETF